MKVVHLNKELSGAPADDEEIKKWEQLIREHPGNDKAHTRLMILYRKKKKYRQELKAINRAIRIFEELFKKREPVYNKKVLALSKALLKATGLADKKGRNLYEQGELTRWRKRKETVLKKLKND